MSAVFDQDTIPAPMRGTYELKTGIWGRIRVREGRLKLHLLESGRETMLDSEADGMMRPRQPCRIELLGPVRFDIAYFGESLAQDDVPQENDLIQAVAAEKAAALAAARVPWKMGPPGLDEEVVKRVVDDFYAKIRSDSLLAPIFDAAIPEERWPHHLRIMYDFWSSMLLGTGRYDGRPLPKHMTLPGLCDDHFVRWLALFRETVEAICLPPTAALFVDRAERVAQSFRLSLAFQRGEDTTAIVPLRAGEPGEAAPRDRLVRTGT